MNSDSFSVDHTVSYKDINEIPKSAFSNNEDIASGLLCSELSYSQTQRWTEKVPKTERNISVFDVAKYILRKLAKPCSTMKLHKLLYYCQAWSMVWNEKPLFYQPIEAWANGPVIRQLFNFHRGMFQLSFNSLLLGNDNLLSESQKKDIDEVLKFYGERSAQWLIDQTHVESPWRDARKGLASNERGNSTISLESMYDYYSSLN